MSPLRLSLRGPRHARALSWFLNVPLTLFAAQSFRAARGLYLERGAHESAGRFTAALLALVLWTAFLTLNAFACALRSRRRESSGGSPDASG